MNKIAKGKARAEKLAVVISDVLAQNDAGLRRLQKTGLITKKGMFSKGSLADAVGMDTVPDTFRQNAAMKALIRNAEDNLSQRDILIEEEDKTKKATEVIGNENEERFLTWLTAIGTDELPAPMNHNGRLYKKALWSVYSEQDLIDVDRPPTWFNSRTKVKEALAELDVKVVQGSAVTQNMDAESISDDRDDSYTSAKVRKLRAEVKELKEKLNAEIEARKDAVLKAEQNAQIATQIPTGKQARN